MEARCSPCRRVRDPREGGLSAPPPSLCQCVVASARERSGVRGWGRGIPKGLRGPVPSFGELWRVGAAQSRAASLPAAAVGSFPAAVLSCERMWPSTGPGGGVRKGLRGTAPVCGCGCDTPALWLSGAG